MEETFQYVTYSYFIHQIMETKNRVDNSIIILLVFMMRLIKKIWILVYLYVGVK